MENSNPGKDISLEDIQSKFPLVAKKDSSHYSNFEIANVEFGPGKCPVFAGPNMVESKELIIDVALNIQKSGASFLRGGAFKPLTFPYRSEKYTETRESGLEWLAEAKSITGMPVITEIMEEKYLSMIGGVADILQIGARNMQNYPLLTACAKSGKPIMLKRGFGCSLRDWLGAAEYILVEGNKRVILCERGIVAPHTHRSTSRFLLDLQVVPAAQEVTHLPVVTDPSHACFWRPWVPKLAKASVAVGANGLMIEVHPDPSQAAVDPLQAIDYLEFNDLMMQLKRLGDACEVTVGSGR
ncbi:3-deoxy-7-phosphoheptulonate synthase [Prochlorococcus marinus]|uniref:3-deoxy-7-phosphoheptulonate synthase n=1 Tax=Prochlorococcus marinus XMU1408 TaxID=2213228 RepID=A0A318QUV8_PROMR|nr:3-deoxy-7-phosphoheptulonate synthase [Prochlorococcus marinus]MBW3042888.1 3-deoxy-7-phosphoheptulonate synthase [Prochlorococcus marinus str. XMU1408]PYE00246.1 3-deoxy-7-phosphoheptulonate synthase [Prochlorococcus marinus XMU1408]